MLLRLVKFHCIFMCSLTCSPPCMPLEYDGFRGISYMLVSMHVCPSVHVLGFDQGDLSLSLSLSVLSFIHCLLVQG